MILIVKRCLSLDIWPKTSDQAKDIEDMMKTVWVKEAPYGQIVSKTKTCFLSPSNKKTKHINPLIFYNITIGLLN